jgi:hypothetical protein
MTVAVQYLLPCSCGQQIVVEPRQAGETTQCSCGASVQIPTLLDMRTLDQAQQTSVAPAKSIWGLKHQLRMLGIVLVVAAVGVGSWLLAHPPTSRFLNIDTDQIRKNAEKMSPVQTWGAWQSMKQRIDPRIDQKYADDLQIYHFELALLTILALLGIAVITAGEIAGRKQGPRVRH